LLIFLVHNMIIHFGNFPNLASIAKVDTKSQLIDVVFM
jgi:hypothetical protein